MLKVFSLAFTMTIAVLLYGASTDAAYAYLDPGTGSMILQVLLGGIAGLALAGRFYWNKFAVMVGLRTEAPAAEQADEAAMGSKPQAER